MQRKRLIGALLFSVLALLLLIALGCPGRSRLTTESGPARYEGVVVRVACPGEPSSAVVAAYAPAWASRAGARVEVVPYDPDSGPSEDSADVWVIPPARMPHWAAAGQLLPVPESYLTSPDYAWRDLLPLYREKLLLWNRTAYALPVLGEAPLCFYRSDLLRDEGYRAEFQKQFGRAPTAPATWEEVLTLAAYFQGRHEAGISGPSLPPLPTNDDALDREFYSVAASCARRAVRDDDPHPPGETELFSFHFNKATMQPRIDTAGFVHALTVLRNLQRYRPSAPAAEPPSVFAQGQAVFCLADASWIQRFQKSPAVKGHFDVCRIPGSRTVFSFAEGKEQTVPAGNYVPYLGAGGWLGVVPQSAHAPEAAFALLADLSGPQLSRQIVIEPRWGGGAFRRTHLESSQAQGWSGFGFDQTRTNGLLNSLRETVDPGIANPVLRLRLPNERPYQRAVLDAVRSALLHDTDPGEALKAAAQAWQELDSREDFQTRQANYSRSLSLTYP